MLLVFAGDHGLTAEGVSHYPASVTAAMVGDVPAGTRQHQRLRGRGRRRDPGRRCRRRGRSSAASRPDRRQDPARHAQRRTRARADERRRSMRRWRAARDLGVRRHRGGRGCHRDRRDGHRQHRFGGAHHAPPRTRAARPMHRGRRRPRRSRPGAQARRASAGRRRAAPPPLPLDVLAEFGGCEIAMMTGAVLGAASQRRPVLVDGFIASAAALAAIRLAPAAFDYCVFAHQSAERGHALPARRDRRAPAARPRHAAGGGHRSGAGRAAAARRGPTADRRRRPERSRSSAPRS